MTSPEEPNAPDDAPPHGEVERVPLKVVPIFVQPIVDEPELVVEDDDDLDAAVSAEDEPRRRTRLVGIAAMVLALGTIGVHIAAVVVSSAGDFVAGAQLGWVAIGLSALAVLVGLVAAIIGRGRAWGIVAVLVAVLANPYVLLTVLRLLSGAQTA